MEQRIVMQGKTKYIYWIKDNNDIFYLTIPASKKVSLVINMISNATDDVVKALNEIEGKILITPVLSMETVDGLKQNNAEYFEKVSEMLSNVLNLSHRILTYNHLEVDNNVFLINSKEFTMFNMWFNKKYEGRVTLLETKESDNLDVRDPLIQSEQNFVKSQEVSMKNENEKTAPIPVEGMDTVMNKNADTEKKDMGFVSYVLLGVIVAVASLLFLYFIL